LNQTKQRNETRSQLSDSIKLQLERELYKQSFYDFFQTAVRVLKPNDDWQFSFHHKYLCDLLQKEAVRINQKKPKNQDFIINIPPATTKSRDWFRFVSMRGYGLV
jgi:hypothetical protein